MVQSIEGSHYRITEFIKRLKGHSHEDDQDAHGILEEIYLNGNCYTFAKALQLVFPSAVLYSVCYPGETGVSHVVVKLGQRFYDIRGEIQMEDQNYEWWHEITEEEEQFSREYVYSFPLRKGIKIK